MVTFFRSYSKLSNCRNGSVTTTSQQNAAQVKLLAARCCQLPSSVKQIDLVVFKSKKPGIEQSISGVNDFSLGNNPESPDDCYTGTFMARDQSILNDVLDDIVTNMSLESVNGSLAKVLNLADGYQTFSVTKTKSENATILRFHVKFCQPANLEFTTCLKLSADITVFYKQ